MCQSRTRTYEFGLAIVNNASLKALPCERCAARHIWTFVIFVCLVCFVVPGYSEVPAAPSTKMPWPEM